MTERNAFADLKDDLDFVPQGAVKPLADIARPRYVTPKAGVSFVESCSKCGGTGIWSGGWNLQRRCLACDGSGKKAFKTSPEVRHQRRERAAELKVRLSDLNAAEWSEANPAEAAWINANAGKFEFATSLQAGLRRYGRLTDGQLAAVRRCVEREALQSAERATERAKAEVSHNNVLKALHDVLQQHNAFYADPLTMTRRKTDQLVWIKHKNAEKVIGKLDNGVLTLWHRPGVDLNAVRAMLERFNAAPLAEAKKMGRLTGRCCSCGRELTDAASIDAGIGPICAQKF